MKVVILFTIAIVVSFSLFVSNACASDEFPLRAQYTDVKVISTDELAQYFDRIIVIDVRSQMEFDIVHINNSIHLPISNLSFVKDLEKVRAKDDDKKLVFYCNGHTCAKSYIAYQKAKEAGFLNLLAYDAGVFDWIMAHPEKATLMGKSPAAKEKIIPRIELDNRMLRFQEFKQQTQNRGAMAIDIRDPFQRGIVPDIAKLRNIPLDKFLILIEQNQFKDKHLLILDAVGKQVCWLQYYLKENGYTNYNFLYDGVAGIK